LLEQHSLFLKPSKCEFFQMAMDYLGIRVQRGELMIDPAKIAGITNWPTTLNSVKEVRSTLGLLGYHRPWIPNFAKVAKPLTDLLQKGRAFAWDQLCEDAVRRLIGLVTSEPVLVPPDTNEQFILYVDASQFATGAILYQADKERKDRWGNPLLRPLGFNSQTFSKTEQNYPIYDRELLAVMRGLRTWRHLTRNSVHPVLVITDHANLQYYREPQKLGPRVNGYVAELAEYHIMLIYKPGAVNRADELSRRPDLAPTDDDELTLVLPNHLFVPPETPSTAYVATRTKAEDYDSDDTLVNSDSESPPLSIKAAAHGTVSPVLLDKQVVFSQTSGARTIRRWRTAHSLSQTGELWSKDGALVVVGNNELNRGLISLFHDSPTAGHPGITKTLALMKPYYWWPGMKGHVTEYIKGCATCQMTKVNTHPTKPPLFPITSEANALPFQTISLDFIVKLPVSDGHDTILTITDHDCSKAAFFIPCNETVDAAGVATLYATHVFPHYGLPKKVISDRDTRFASNFSRELCDILKIRQNISTAYHPQTDGQSERTNQSLEQYLRLYCGSRQDDWAHWLPLAQYTHNSWPNATTKKAPFELILGFVPQAHQPDREATIPDISMRISNIKEAREEAQAAISKTQEKMIKNSKFVEFKINDQVWLDGANIKRPYASKKLSPRRYGPFRVVAKISHVAYRLQLPNSWGIHNVFHAALLTPYKETPEHGPNFLEPPPEVIEGEEEWEVEQILGKRHFGRGRKLQYLVRWKGYSPAHDQWINRHDLHANDLIAEYESRTPPRRSIRTPRRKPTDTIRTLRLQPPISHPPYLDPDIAQSPLLLPPTSRTRKTRPKAEIDAIRILLDLPMSDASTSESEVSSPQVPLRETTPAHTSTRVHIHRIPTVDAAIFAGTTQHAPTQFAPILTPGTGTPRLTLVPIGGTFISSEPPPHLQSQPPTASDKQRSPPRNYTTLEQPLQPTTTPPPPPPRNPSLSRVARISTGHPGDLGDRADPQRLETLWRRASVTLLRALKARRWREGSTTR